MSETGNKIYIDTKQYPVYPVIFQNGKECFRITPKGEIEKDGVQITDDNSAVADLLREWLLHSYGLKIRPAVRSKWILVRDQLPPTDRLVLFCCDIDGEFTQVIAGQFSGNWTESKNAVAMELDGDDWAPCSHWMELPEPPKK
jgi:hypothetical protein